MNIRILSFIGASLALLIVGCSEHQVLAPTSARAHPPMAKDVTTGSGCQLASGTATFTKFAFTSPTTAESAGNLTGDISGTFAVQYYDLTLNGDGSGFLKSNHVLTLSTGTILTQDDIVLLPVDNPDLFRPVAHLFITGGTGAYAGASGQLMVQGEYNHVTLAGSLQFKADICVP